MYRLFKIIMQQLVLQQCSFDEYRAIQSVQDKARVAGNGHSLAKTLNAVLDALGCSLRAIQKTVIHVVASFVKGTTIPFKTRLVANGFLNRCIHQNYVAGVLAIVCLFFLPAQSYAANIDFKDFKLQGTPKNYQINTRVDFELTDYLRNALQNGITLNARIQFRLGKHNSWWFNKDTALLTVSYQLKYHALSRHYLLSRNDTNEHWNFSSLPSAIRKLSELRQYSLPDISASLSSKDSKGKYYILAAADMNPSTLNLPLRFQSLFSDQYKLTSEGVVWPLP